MKVDAPATAEDQEHFDLAFEERERSRRLQQTAPEAALHRGGAETIRRQAQATLEDIGRPEDPVAFGRIDKDDGETWYIGRRAIWDETADPLVIGWQSEPAQPFYRATAADPAGVKLKRTFECEENKILSFEDVVYEQLHHDVTELEAGAMDDALLDDLGRHRSGEMADIVKTIQASQYDLLREARDQLLIIEGGPGTGKTAVGLHRVSWLLFNHKEDLSPRDVLVIGPNRTFVRYIRQVLPELGDADVVQVDLNQLGPTVRLGRAEPEEVARIKGGLRMQGLLRRALANRVRTPADDIRFSVSGSSVDISASAVAEEISRLKRFAYAEGRNQFRSFIRAQVAGRYSRDTRPFEEEISKVTDRAWPAMTAESLVQDLYGSRTRLVAAAGDDFTGRDIELLYRQAAERVTQERWSEADVAVLDFATHLIDPSKSTTYGHIVIDEAQDLSPMQADVVGRRSRDGSMTVLGDIAQSTGPWARDSWQDLIDTLSDDRVEASIRTLRYGYRVPTQVYELAGSFLHRYEPDATLPDAVREGPTDPMHIDSAPEDLASDAVQEARGFASDGLSVGLVCPEIHWGAVTNELTDLDVRWTDVSAGELSGSINVVRPDLAKGLEFDAVVIVDPIAVRAHERGHRLLYIAMTRTTTHLTLVGPIMETPELDEADWDEDASWDDATAEDEAAEDEDDDIEHGSEDDDLAEADEIDDAAVESEDDHLPRVVEAVAEVIASDVRELQPDRWAQTLRRAAEILEIDLDE